MWFKSCKNCSGFDILASDFSTSGFKLFVLLRVFLRKHSDGPQTEMENEGNFIAHQTTHYLKTERVIDLVRSTKGTDIYPFLAFSAGLK